MAPRKSSSTRRSSTPTDGKPGLSTQKTKVSRAVTRNLTPKESSIDQGFLTALAGQSAASTPSLECSVSPHVLVGAGAGCGKTSTMEAGYNALMGRRLPFTPSASQEAIIAEFAKHRMNEDVHFLAYNSSIAEEFKSRNLPGSTFHSFGNRALRSGFPRVRFRKPSDWKTADILEDQFHLPFKEHPELHRVAKELCSLAKNGLLGYTGSTPFVPCATTEEVLSLIDHHDIEASQPTLDKILEILNPLLGYHASTLLEGDMDFDDMIWGPLVHGLALEHKDLLIVDECQDLNRSRMVLAQRIIQGGQGRRLGNASTDGRLFAVGDVHQAIYGFAGADAESYEKFHQWMVGSPRGGNVLPLMETRRCPKDVVSLVNDWVPELKALPEAPQGLVAGIPHWDPSHPLNGPGRIPAVPWDFLVGERTFSGGASTSEGGGGSANGGGIHMKWVENNIRAIPGDFILCPINAPLVNLAYRLIRNNIRCRIKGRDIGNGIKSVIRKAQENEGVSSIPELIVYVEKTREKELTKLLARKKPPENLIRNVEDRFDCILFLVEGVDNIGELINRVDALFADIPTGATNDTVVTLSSCHKAKGLEAKRVFIVRPEFLPPPWCKQEWELTQGRNLRYVAFTRTKHTLVGCETPESHLRG